MTAYPGMRHQITRKSGYGTRFLSAAKTPQASSI
jgi:hypothetical protein